MKEIILIMMIGMLGLVSAVSITPDKLNLNLSVGESYTTQFEIYSEIESNVSIESLNPNCLMNENFSVDSGINYKNLTIYIPFDANLMEQDCEFKINFINVPSIEVARVGGGHRRVSPSITPNNTTKNITNSTANNETINLNNETSNITNNKTINSSGFTDEISIWNRSITQEETIKIWVDNILNKITNFFKLKWDWFKGLFK